MKRTALTKAALMRSVTSLLMCLLVSVVPRTVYAAMCPTQTEIDTVTLINQERQNNGGLPPLVIDLRLVEAARLHSQDMATNNFFSHTGSSYSQPPDSEPWDRMEQADYVWYRASENIAAGYATPDAVVSAWMKSSGHRANILDPNVRDIGLGHAYGPVSFYGQYWTVDFGRTCSNCTVTGPCDWADFSTSPTSGSAPLTVIFTDRSLITARAWSWDFGDGSTSTLRNPVHTYPADGTYTVTLTINVWGISDGVVKAGCVNVMSCDAQARVGDQSFGTIQPTYDHAQNLDSVDARAVDFQEDLMFDNNTSVAFRGGFDCNYNSNVNRYTTVSGTITIGGTDSGEGGVVVENIIIK